MCLVICLFVLCNVEHVLYINHVIILKRAKTSVILKYLHVCFYIVNSHLNLYVLNKTKMF